MVQNQFSTNGISLEYSLWMEFIGAIIHANIETDKKSAKWNWALIHKNKKRCSNEMHSRSIENQLHLFHLFIFQNYSIHINNNR